MKADKKGTIESPHHFGARLPIEHVLSHLAAGEGCDGTPYDEMQAAADWIAQVARPVLERPDLSKFALSDLVKEIERRCRFSHVVCELKDAGRDANFRIYTHADPKQELALQGAVELGKADVLEGVRKALMGGDTVYVEDIVEPRKRADEQGEED